MSLMKLEVKPEPEEQENSALSEFQQEPELRDTLVARFKKEEPEEVEIKAEPHEFPMVHESVKKEEEDSLFSHPAVKEEDAKHGENSSDTDDSEDWARSAEKGERKSGSDSESSFEFDAPTKTKTKRQMEDYPNWAPAAPQTLPEIQRLTCSHCGKEFNSSVSLKVHEQNHKRVRSFPCPVCSKVFTRLENLNVHTRRHTGERPFRCSVCERRFVAKVYLTLHMRAHAGKKPFKCAVCGKGFALRYLLTRHVKTHSGEKPFECPVCAKRFTTKSILGRHLKTHRGGLSEHVEYVQRILSQKVL